MILPNDPDLWRANFPEPTAKDHKYSRGHTAIFGANTYTGATRLAAAACSRIGSGLVTVLSQAQAPLYRTVLPADIMIQAGRLDTVNRPTTLLAGPGGLDDQGAAEICASDAGLGVVLDADAIRLCSEVAHKTKIVTPHDGEFERYFGKLTDDRVAAAVEIARAKGAVVVLKGAHTLVAAPDGRVSQNQTASPYLAKAGTGDVLAGLVSGLLAQGMPAFDAASAGVWLHGAASLRVGPGLVPQDLLGEIRPLLRDLLV